MNNEQCAEGIPSGNNEQLVQRPMKKPGPDISEPGHYLTPLLLQHNWFSHIEIQYLKLENIFIFRL